LVLLCAAPLGSATAVHHDVVEFEQGVFRVPSGWQRVRRADPNEQISLILAVKQTNTDKLEAALLAVSSLDSKLYGKHLSVEEVHSLVAPSPLSIAVVEKWLKKHKIPSSALKRSPSSDFITVTVAVSKAERMLSAEYYLYKHDQSGHEILRLDRPYTLPRLMRAHLDFIAPTVHFPRVRTMKMAESPSSNALFIAPDVLRQLYQVGGAQGSNSSSNIQAIASFLEQYYSPTDLQTFFTLFQNTSVGHTVSKEVGTNVPSAPGVEAELDVQYIMSVGQGVQTWVYYTAGRSPTNPENEPFLAWLLNVTAESQIPNVFSVSYGEDEKSVGLDYATRINVEFQKLGARGVSIMVASGDNGAGGNCSSTGRLSPDFPSGSPWVTAVGGVTGGTPGSTPTGEVTDMISGGGFSDLWPRPSYQDDAIAKYIKTGKLPDPIYWNQSGRGYPDVAAQSEGFLVVTFGIPMPVSGTSCASPTFAGVVSLLNEVRISKGKSPLGFLNPLLYQIAPTTANSFNDVTVGSNLGCGHGGFPAIAGWDAATGWGSPNYSILSSVVAELP